MAARANPFFDVTTSTDARTDAYTGDVRSEPRSAIAKLAILHAEAKETARLAELLRRSLYTALALPLAAALTIVLCAHAGTPPRVAWGVLIVVASLAVARAYASAMGQPLERAELRIFVQDLRAVLLYSGFAWGTGAFLLLTNSAPIGAALVFVTAPTLGLVLLLRERNAVLMFLAPVATLTSFACVLRPLNAGALNAALVLFASVVFASILIARDRRRTDASMQDTPIGLSGY